MRILPIYAVIALFFISCKSQFPIAYNSSKAKDPAYNAFIRTKKGEMITGDDVQKKNEAKLFKPTLYSINGTEYKAKEIAEYQDKSGLYTNIQGGFSKALTGPNIFVFKNESTSSTYSGPSMGQPNGKWSTSKSTVYYIKKAGQEDYKVVGLNSAKQLAEWVEDNNDAYEQATLSQKWSKSIKTNRLISWGAIVGGMVMMLNDPAVKTGAAPDKKLGVMGYGGFALFSGGIVNLTINLAHRRGKAGRAYASAINIYNEAPAKKKK